MIDASKFIKYTIVISITALIVLLFIHQFTNHTQQYVFPILWGLLLAFLNFIAGLTSIKLGINKSPNLFLLNTLGGMVGRIFLLLAAVFISVSFLEISLLTFIFSILFFYILYLIVEILYLNLRKN
jgi:hypothetical protein